jgi:hypothetical protein
MWEDNGSLTDDINSLRVLNETLEMVTIASCQRDVSVLRVTS